MCKHCVDQIQSTNFECENCTKTDLETRTRKDHSEKTHSKCLNRLGPGDQPDCRGP